MTTPTIVVDGSITDNHHFPDFPVHLHGQLSADGVVASVQVRITDLTSGLVWDDAHRVWVAGSTTWNAAGNFDDHSWSFDFQPSGASSGLYLVTAMVWEQGGQFGITPVPQRTFRVASVDVDAPSISVTRPSVSGEVFRTTPVTLSGTVHDNVRVESVIVRISDLSTGLVWDGDARQWSTGSTTWNDATLATEHSWSYQFDPDDFSAGQCMVTAIARDSFGNTQVTNFPQKTFRVKQLVTILFDGDSTVFGAGAVHGVNDFPTQLHQGLVPVTSFHCINSGVGGARIEQLILDASVAVDTHIRQENMLVLWVGTNDLLQGDSAANMYRELTRYIADRHAAGWRVTLLTLPPSELPAAANAQRIAYNDFILGNTARADRVLNVHEIPELQDPSDLRYRTADGIHYMPAGYTLIADFVRPHIQALASFLEA